jgi:alpha-1,3-fucosyltransferase
MIRFLKNQFKIFFYKLKKNFRFYLLLLSICLFYVVFIYTNNYENYPFSNSNDENLLLFRRRNDEFLRNLIDRTNRKVLGDNIDINIVKNNNHDFMINGIENNNQALDKKKRGSATSTSTRASSTTTYGKCDPVDPNYMQYAVELNGQTYPKTILPHLNKSINFACINNNPKATTKIILTWNDWWGKFYGYGKKTPFEANYCPVTNCEFTDDKKRLNESDLVVVHGLDPIQDQPTFRPPNQRWVFFFYESPFYSTNARGLTDDFFNYTSTYRLDSDFPGFYEASSLFFWEHNPGFKENFDFFSQKTKFAAIVITRDHQNDLSARFTYINELKKYIEVDIFYPTLSEPTQNGLPCPKSFKDNRTIHLIHPDHPHHGICKEVIASEYKFYFAFENSICDQYITEEFFSILRRDIVPVVIGAGPYDYYVTYIYFSHFFNIQKSNYNSNFLFKVPKTAYVNALDYKTPKDLANYLLYLNGNPKKYNEIFNWKKHIRTVPYSLNISPLCDMCIKLHLEHYYGLERKIRKNVESDWSMNKNCKLISSNETKFFNFVNT